MTEPINASIAEMIRTANTASAQGDYARAQQIAREAVKRATYGTQHRPTQAAAHYTLCAALWADETASAEEAHQHAARALELAIPHTDEYYLSMTILARIDAGLGNLESARGLNENLLQIYRRKNRRRGIADALRNLGDLALKENDLAAAREYFEQSLAIYGEGSIDDPINHAGLLLSLGSLAFREGDQDQARRHWEAALDLGEGQRITQIVQAARQGLDILDEMAAGEE